MRKSKGGYLFTVGAVPLSIVNDPVVLVVVVAAIVSVLKVRHYVLLLRIMGMHKQQLIADGDRS